MAYGVMAESARYPQRRFPKAERVTATAVAIIANNAGAACGFVGPFLVDTAAELPRP